MNNIDKKKYVTYDQAVKLKEKEFNEECKYFYDMEFKELTFHIGDVGDIYRNSEIVNGYGKLNYPMISAPRLTDVVDWLLKHHDIWVYTYPVKPFNPFEGDEHYPNIVWVSKVLSLKQVNFEKFIDADNGLAVNHHHTPEDAISAALDFLLKDNTK